jgi:hypothetical protein
MSDDDVDRRLSGRGARWREAEPPPPAVDPEALTTRRTPRWVVPVAAAAAVVAVVAGGAVLVGRDGDSAPPPVDTASPSPDRAGVVPFEPIDPRHPKYPAPTRVLVPDPRDAEGAEDCPAGSLRAESTLRAALGTMVLDVLVSAPESMGCALRGRPEVRLLSGGELLDVRTEPRIESGGWRGDVVMGDGHRAVLRLFWPGSWCAPPVVNDRIALTWPGGGRVEVDGFVSSPGCNTPGSAEPVPVSVAPVEPEHWRWKTVQTLAPDTMFVRQYDAELGAPGEPSTFIVALGGNGQEVDLAPCPDVAIRIQDERDDFTVVRHGLNCDAIPYRRADGTAYLPKNQAVRFAFELVLPEQPAERITWRLMAPEPTELRLDPPVRIPADAPVQLVEEDQANLHLSVSSENAYADGPVPIKVWVDDVLVVHQRFDPNGHLLTGFPLRVPPGEHGVRIEGPGLARDAMVRVPEDGDRYALITYWDDDLGRRFDWRVQDSGFMIA